MRLAALAGFSLGTLLVLWAFWRELSHSAEQLRLTAQEQQEADWRRFLAKWEQAA